MGTVMVASKALRLVSALHEIAGRARPPSTVLLLLLLLALQVAGTVAASVCPPRCSCQRGGEQASCVRLTSIPRLLGRSIRSLSITEHQVVRLSSTSFQGLERLEELEITGGRLSEIEDDSFSSLRNLRRLNISHNELTWLSPDAFLTCHDLTFLDLSWNALMLPTAGPMLASVSLSVLHMNSCSLTTLSDDVFSGTPALTEVILFGNNLHAVSECIYLPLKHLVLLDVDPTIQFTECSSEKVETTVFLPVLTQNLSMSKQAHNNLHPNDKLPAYQQITLSVTLPLWSTLVITILEVLLLVTCIHKRHQRGRNYENPKYSMLGGHQTTQLAATQRSIRQFQDRRISIV